MEERIHQDRSDASEDTGCPEPKQDAQTAEQAAKTFYAKVTKRADIRELLKRLADR